MGTLISITMIAAPIIVILICWIKIYRKTKDKLFIIGIFGCLAFFLVIPIPYAMKYIAHKPEPIWFNSILSWILNIFPILGVLTNLYCLNAATELIVEK